MASLPQLEIIVFGRFDMFMVMNERNYFYAAGFGRIFSIGSINKIIVYASGWRLVLSQHLICI